MTTLFWLGWILVAAVIAYRLGQESGRREEERQWRFTTTTDSREIYRRGEHWTVMTREQFWYEWRNPLIRARRGMKS